MSNQDQVKKFLADARTYFGLSGMKPHGFQAHMIQRDALGALPGNAGILLNVISLERGN